jgi:hypothetical protein
MTLPYPKLDSCTYMSHLLQLPLWTEIGHGLGLPGFPDHTGQSRLAVSSQQGWWAVPVIVFGAPTSGSGTGSGGRSNFRALIDPPVAESPEGLAE